MVQYEDRSKLMHGSLSTKPEFQVVAETEAENLVVRDSERILKESGFPRLNFNPGSKVVHTENRRGTDSLVPQDPLILGGGTISTGPKNSLFLFRNQEKQQQQVCDLDLCVAQHQIFLLRI